MSGSRCGERLFLAVITVGLLLSPASGRETENRDIEVDAGWGHFSSFAAGFPEAAPVAGAVGGIIGGIAPDWVYRHMSDEQIGDAAGRLYGMSADVDPRTFMP